MIIKKVEIIAFTFDEQACILDSFIALEKHGDSDLEPVGFLTYYKDN